MWLGTSATTLLQIKDNIDTNTTYTLSKTGSSIQLKNQAGTVVSTITDANTTYNDASQSSHGLMTAADKKKLDTLATVATSGSYMDLSDKPTIPIIPSALKNPNALTISLNGASQGGYDGSAAKSINVTASSVGAVPNTKEGTSAAINLLDLGEATPTDPDYIITQTVGGGTQDTRYIRRPMSAIWSYIKSKADSTYQTKGSYAAASHTHSAANITSGTLDVARIPDVSSKVSIVDVSKLSGQIAAANLPSYVDDVLEYSSLSKFPTKGEAGKIYTATDTNKIYRWSGSAYVVISETIALGTTHSSAGYGDESRAAYNHSTSTGNPHKTTKTDLGLGNVENKSSATIRGELTKANITTALGYTPPTTDTNTHYTTRIVAGAASGTANAATSNGNTHINVTDDNVFRSGVVIKGSGATAVASDANGNITVSSTDTNTWRGIQNNLTSTATDQSLSAAQGKILNEKFGSYVPTSRTVNGKALSANITLSAGNVGAAAADVITISSSQPTSSTCKIWLKI